MGRKQRLVPAIFLDRDGVINHDSPEYIKNVREFSFIPGSAAAIARMSLAGWPVILVTNQSIIGRRMVPMEDLTAIFLALKKGVAEAGGEITDIFFCPHTPMENCDCRKPEPGMILAASKRHSIDLSASVLVGDSAKDILAARNAGVGCTILVGTGNGCSARGELRNKGIKEDHFFPDLSSAADWILEAKCP